MKWTKKKPTKAGWYWVRDKINNESRIVKVRWYAGNWAIGNSSIWEDCEWSDKSIPEPIDKSRE